MNELIKKLARAFDKSPQSLAESLNISFDDLAEMDPKDIVAMIKENLQQVMGPDAKSIQGQPIKWGDKDLEDLIKIKPDVFSEIFDMEIPDDFKLGDITDLFGDFKIDDITDLFKKGKIGIDKIQDLIKKGDFDIQDIQDMIEKGEIDVDVIQDVIKKGGEDIQKIFKDIVLPDQAPDSPDSPGPGKKEETVPTGTESIDYTIQRGDTLSELAQEYNTTVDELMRANPYIQDKDKIYTGKKLIIPGQGLEGVDIDASVDTGDIVEGTEDIDLGPESKNLGNIFNKLIGNLGDIDVGKLDLNKIFSNIPQNQIQDILKNLMGDDASTLSADPDTEVDDFGWSRKAPKRQANRRKIIDFLKKLGTPQEGYTESGFKKGPGKLLQNIFGKTSKGITGIDEMAEKFGYIYISPEGREETE